MLRCVAQETFFLLQGKYNFNNNNKINSPFSYFVQNNKRFLSYLETNITCKIIYV